MRVSVVLGCVVALALLQTALACASCKEVPLTEFFNGDQNPNCYYEDGYTRQVAPSHEQDARDYYWVRYAHEFGVANNPMAPFVGAIVNYTSNQLLCIGVNQWRLGDPKWDSYISHGEIVAIQNCTNTVLPDVEINGAIVANPGWKDVILYGNVETCPMCAQALVWRGLPRAVFGARAAKLGSERCWTQPTLTVQEVADHNSNWFQFEYLRGPLPELEDYVLTGFADACKR